MDDTSILSPLSYSIESVRALSKRVHEILVPILSPFAVFVLTNFLLFKDFLSDRLKVCHLSLCIVDMELCGSMQFEAGNIREFESTNITDNVFDFLTWLLDLQLLIWLDQTTHIHDSNYNNIRLYFLPWNQIDIPTIFLYNIRLLLIISYLYNPLPI